MAFDRKDVSKLNFQHNRSIWLGNAKALVGATPSVTVKLHQVTILRIIKKMMVLVKAARFFVCI